MTLQARILEIFFFRRDQRVASVGPFLSLLLVFRFLLSWGPVERSVAALLPPHPMIYVPLLRKQQVNWRRQTKAIDYPNIEMPFRIVTMTMSDDVINNESLIVNRDCL